MEAPRVWRERETRYRGIGIECMDCGKKSFPSTRQCPYCASENVKPYQIARTGKIKYFTKINDTGDEMLFTTPYIVALIELDDGLTVTAQIVDCEYEDLKVDTPVKMVFRVLSKDGVEGLIRYGFKFMPILNKNK